MTKFLNKIPKPSTVDEAPLTSTNCKYKLICFIKTFIRILIKH